ncbi:MAG: hypothetical protein FWH36_06405 [Lentimicrobiaceae bacterium]|nr:hypothetical protein [Lentimicrobiaceae bacterium]
MATIQIISLFALGWCFVFCLRLFLRLVKLGKVNDLSQKSGNVTRGILYSNTAAMLPNKKESAYKHLPTFTAGVVFHIGSFLSLLLFVLSFFSNILLTWIWRLPVCLVCLACFLLISSLCGLVLFFKRVFSKKLRPFSNLDDFFSIGIVTLFQLFSVALLALFAAVRGKLGIALWVWISDFYITWFHDFYYSTAIVLFLYLPFGKLKHAIYYFAARYHLGFFYGWRNAWPPQK